MSRRLSSNFIAAFLVVFLAVVLGLKVGIVSGFYPSLALIALIAGAFFLDFSPLIFLVVFGVLILNWRPGLSPEILALVALPIAVYILRKFFPARAWLNFILAITLGLLVFYSAAGFPSLVKNFNIFLADLVISTLFAIPIFIIFKSLQGHAPKI